MSSKIWLINLVLMAAVIFFGIKAYEVWPKGKKLSPETVAVKKPLPWVEKKIAKRSTPPESDYGVVVSSNLFSNDRLERPPQQEKPATTKPEGKVSRGFLNLLERAQKNTNLYGVVIVDNHKEAFIGEVSAHKGKRVGERGVKRARVGDTVGRFKVKEINDTNVLLSAGGHEWRISMFDKDKPKKRAQVKKDDGPIVIVGGSNMKPVLTEAKTVKKGPTPKPVVSKKETSPKPQDKKKTIPVPTDRSRTKKR